MALVSVVIPCFNARAWIAQTLRSVLGQAEVPLEVIVVDDGSNDGSAELVAGQFPGVRLYTSAHRGASAARNEGTRRAQGEYLQYLDADDLLLPRKIAVQLKALERSGGDVAYSDWARLREEAGGQAQVEPVRSTVLKDPEIALFTDGWRPPLAYLFRRSIVDKTGGWNESLPVIQDARFVLDCALQGGRFVYAPGVYGYYRVHGTQSLSRRDPRLFDRDVLRNAVQVQRWWEEHGGITPARKEALLETYGYLARSGYAADRALFEDTLRCIQRLVPRYIPRRPRALRFLSMAVGYRRAEDGAALYRRVKRLFSKGSA